MIADFCIIGGGISGLYFVKRLQESMPDASYVLLEADPKRFGGRIQVSRFAGVDVVEGAGVGRVGKDNRLLGLCEELGVSYPQSPQQITYSTNFAMSQEECSRVIMDCLSELRSKAKEFRERDDRTRTFSKFAKVILGKERYELFRRLVGYTDYDAADVIDTIDDYGFDDTYTNEKKPRSIASIDWKSLISELLDIAREGRKSAVSSKENIFEENEITDSDERKCVRLGARVISIRMVGDSKSKSRLPMVCIDYHDSHTNTTRHQYCKHVVMAIPISKQFLSILPPSCLRSISPSYCSLLQTQVHTQPFLRVYAKIDRRASHAFEQAMEGGYTVVDNILQKIIPIDAKKGVYMVAYSDNDSALELYDMIREYNSDKNDSALLLLEKLICAALGLRLMEKDNDSHQQKNPNIIRIIDIKYFFWEAGTHFFSPLHQGKRGGIKRRFSDRLSFLEKAVKPLPWISILGESVSTNQGWTEGALTRVDDAITELNNSIGSNTK